MRFVAVAALVAALVSCEQPLTAEDVRAIVAESEPVEEAPTETATDDTAEDAPEEVSPVRPEPEPVEADPVADPEPEPTPEPAWQPNAGTIYIVAADDSTLYSEAPTPDRWARRSNVYRGHVELINRDRTQPGPYPYRFAAGTPPEVGQ